MSVSQSRRGCLRQGERWNACVRPRLSRLMLTGGGERWRLGRFKRHGSGFDGGGARQQLDEGMRAALTAASVVAEGAMEVGGAVDVAS